MSKNQFFENIEEIVTDKIYICEELNQIEKEIEENCWQIGISDDDSKEINKQDLIVFFNRTVMNRKKQLMNSGKKIDILFYLWFEAQSGHLKLNFINGSHNLPFQCNIDVVDTMSEILDDFLNYEFHNGIPLSELNEVDKIDTDQDFVQKVFTELISINK